MRGAPGYGRSRPNCCSMASRRSSSARAGSAVSPTAAAFRNAAACPTPTGRFRWKRRDARGRESTRRERVATRRAQRAPRGRRDCCRARSRRGTPLIRRLLHPPGRQHAARRARAAGAAAEHILEAGGGLLEQALVLQRLAEHDVRASSGGARASSRRPAAASARTNAPSVRASSSRMRAERRRLDLLAGLRRPPAPAAPPTPAAARAELGQRVLQPRDVRLLAADHVLVGVVEVVVADDAGARLVALSSASRSAANSVSSCCSSSLLASVAASTPSAFPCR